MGSRNRLMSVNRLAVGSSLVWNPFFLCSNSIVIDYRRGLIYRLVGDILLNGLREWQDEGVKHALENN